MQATLQGKGEKLQGYKHLFNKLILLVEKNYKHKIVPIFLTI